MKNERIIQERYQRNNKYFKLQALRSWVNRGRSAEMTAKELGVGVFEMY
jgi:hypothetical protein